jgi:hypothetical protein
MMVAKKAKVNRFFREKDCGVGSRLNRKGNMGFLVLVQRRR